MTDRSAKIQIAIVICFLTILWFIKQTQYNADVEKKTAPLPEPKVLFSTDLKKLKGFEDCTFSTILVYVDQTMGPVMNVIRCAGTPVLSVDSKQKEHEFIAITNQE